MTFEDTLADVENRFSLVEGREPEAHKKLLTLVNQLKREGEDALSGYQSRMEKADKIYRAFRVPDEKDRKAAERGEPTKIIYPVSYAQIQTTLAALMAILDSNPFFELEGRNPNYYRGARLLEVELQYQLDYIGWSLHLYQFLLDALRYGFGKVNIGYVQDQAWIRADNPMAQIPLIGMMFPEQTDQLVMGYEGAHLSVEDPYDLNFDPAVTVGSIQEGSFVFKTEEMTFNQLKHVAEQRHFFNFENLPKGKLGGTGLIHFSERDRGRGKEERSPQTSLGIGGGRSQIKGNDKIRLDVCWLKIVPKDYELSELDDQQIWQVTIANGARVIGAEPSTHQHGMFPTAVGEYSPDKHELINDGMAQTIDGMQEHINWLLNSHMDNVRKVINDVLLVDPSGVEVEDLIQRKSVIRLKKTVQGQDVRKFISQLQVTDVTRDHPTHAANIHRILQQVTGIDDTSMGVQLPTERTATEIQSKQRNAAGRVKLLARLLFVQALRPIGTQMIQNTQQFMSQERWLRVTSGMAIQLGADPNGYVQISPAELQGLYDIKIKDAATPSDRVAKASYMKELLGMFMQNPMFIQVAGADVSMLLMKIFTNLDMGDMSDVIRPPTAEMQNMLIQAMQQMPTGPVEAKVSPDEEVARELQKGNLIPTGGGNGVNAPGSVDRAPRFS